MTETKKNFCFNLEEDEAQPVIDMLSRMSIDGDNSYMLVCDGKEGLVQVVRYRPCGDTVWTLVALHDGPDVHCAASGQKVGDGAFERALAVCSWLLCIDETERPSMTEDEFIDAAAAVNGYDSSACTVVPLLPF